MVAGLGKFLSCTKLHAYSNCIGIIVTCITVTEAAQSFKVPMPKSGSSCSTLVSCSLTLRPRRGEGESPVKIELSQHLIWGVTNYSIFIALRSFAVAFPGSKPTLAKKITRLWLFKAEVSSYNCCGCYYYQELWEYVQQKAHTCYISCMH